MYKSKKGWYYKRGTEKRGIGPFETAEEAKTHTRNRAKLFHVLPEACYWMVYYGTPCRLSAAKDVYIKNRGHVYFTRVR